MPLSRWRLALEGVELALYASMMKEGERGLEAEGVKVKVITSKEEMHQESRAHRKRGASIGFVPTMGALHEGHCSLLRRARKENDIVVLSIFVNPIQFNDEEDYKTYPRTLEADLERAESVGVDFVFAPTIETMYSPRRDTVVLVDKLAQPLCGMSRGRGHFIGVCTVVTKLFHIVEPDVAYFGQKDAQQALIIQRMVIDLDFPIRIVVCPIVREEDGLAMSSRNVRIPRGKRSAALSLRKALVLGRELLRAGERNASKLAMQMAESILHHPGVELDYLEIVSPETLEDVETIDDVVLIAGAIRVGGVRLIDNLLVGPDGPWEDPPV